jgi:hypothetical protein
MFESETRYFKLIIKSLTSSQFSHKQLVLVTAPVSTGAYFFVYGERTTDSRRALKSRTAEMRCDCGIISL